MLSRFRWLLLLAVFIVAGITVAQFVLSLLFQSPGSSTPTRSHPKQSLSALEKVAFCPKLPPLRDRVKTVTSTLAPSPKSWDPSEHLKGGPAKKFKDNLLQEKFYITAWSNAGFTNQFMSYVNMIYMGLISDRIPIVPPFGPDHHIPLDAGVVPFGDIFNLTRARDATNLPILEWRDVKELPSLKSGQRVNDEEREHLGCWSTRPGNNPNPLRVGSIVDHLKLDISYTRAPTEARVNPSDGNDDHLVFSKLVRYIYPKRPLPPPNGHYTLMEKSPMGKELLPDNHMTCFDFLYYATSSPETFEWKFSWAPAWTMVGKHMHFTDRMVELASGYLARAFGAFPDRLPPFIAVHMRRGDFAFQCWDTPGDCLIPLSKFERRVNEMKLELWEKHDIVVKEVVLMSDEKDPEFWEEVHYLGWVRIDHEEEKTVDKYGSWYPPLVDIVAQSMASGFIGTHDSTFSLVSARRVEDWNDKPVAFIAKNDRDVYYY